MKYKNYSQFNNNNSFNINNQKRDIHTLDKLIKHRLNYLDNKWKYDIISIQIIYEFLEFLIVNNLNNKL